MLESMTGFGSSILDNGTYQVKVEARSINGKGLSIKIFPRELISSLEQEIEKLCRKYFNRGRIEIIFSVIRLSGSIPDLELDLELAAGFVRVSKELSERFDLENNLSSASLIRYPGVISGADVQIDEKKNNLIHSAADIAFKNLKESRKREGYQILEEMKSGIEMIERIVENLKSGQKKRSRERFLKTRKRIEKLLSGITIPDETRLLQELAFIIEKSDTSEECNRLLYHFTEFRHLLEDNGGGRKIGFLLQEIHREINTLGSKLDDATTIHEVLEIKDILAGLREQIANVE